jgi:uncharacterized protein involved in exopolysaccharide biosynthesis
MLYAEIKRVRAEMVRRRLDELKLEQLRLAANADETALADCLAKLKGQLGKTKAIQSDADIVVQAVPPSDAAFPKPILAYLGTFLAACLAGAASTAPRAGLRRSWDAQMRRIRGCAQGAPSQDRP